MRYFGFLLAAALLGCAHSGSVVTTEEGVAVARYRRIGVVPFVDPRGQGHLIAEGIANGLQRLMYTPIDPKVLEKTISKYKPDQDAGLGLEAMEDVHDHTSADSLLFGRMAPDWSIASIILVETNMGDQILRAILKPRDKNKKAFTSPDEVVQETLRVLTEAH